MKQYLTQENIITLSLALNVILFITAVYFIIMYRYFKTEFKNAQNIIYSNLQTDKLSKQKSI